MYMETESCFTETFLSKHFEMVFCIEFDSVSAYKAYAFVFIVRYKWNQNISMGDYTNFPVPSLFHVCFA